MIFWIKKTDGTVVQLEDSAWRAKIYAAGPAVNDLEYVKSTIEASHLVSAVRKTQKRIDVFSLDKAEVLEFELNHTGRGKKLAGLLSNVFRHPGMFQLYNVDFLPEQSYFYEHDLFPLARVDVEVDSANKIQKWYLLDSVTWYDYETPELKTLELEIKISGCVPRMDASLLAITLTAISPEDEREEVPFEGPEAKIISDAAAFIAKYDPDLIITTNGDSFVLPFLYSKASAHSLQKVWNLNRDAAIDAYAKTTNQGGKTYFSYGRILYRPATQRLFGRLHLDQGNTFIYDQCRLQGLFEVTRLCRIPMHTSMRASIGKCLSSLQFYYATKQGLLIPWKPEIVEDGKNAYDLFVADRGGMVLKPSSGGVYERVGEVDFASLYPSIIRKYNISAETVNCECCPNSREHWVEELKMHICEREGIIARSLVLPLDKRKEYKRLKSNEDHDSRLRQIYNERSASLKWILVCCLAKESPILVQRNGVVQYVKIGSFIDSIVGEKEGVLDCPEDVLVAGIDHEFKSKFCKIKKVLKIPNRQKLLAVTMDDGQRIVTTPNHPFYLLKNGSLVVKQAAELEIGNFVPVAKKLPSQSQNERFVDVIDSLTKSVDDAELGRWRVSGEILSQILLDNKQLILEESIKSEYSYQSIRVWIKKGYVPLRFFNLLKVPFELRKNLRVGIGRERGKFGITSWIPAIIPIGEELGFFLGLYASDGSTTNTYIRLDIGYFETDLLENACKIVNSLFHVTPRVYRENNVNMFVVQINNLALTKFVSQILGIPNTSEKGKLKVPQIILNSDKIVAEGFLEGVLAGDGSMNKAKTFASIATVSKDFANQIGFLSARLNLGFRLAIHSRTLADPMYTINFVGPETLKIISQWKYLKKAHLTILSPKLDYLCNETGNLNCAHPSYHQFPTDESGIVLLVREGRTVRTPRLDQRVSACPYRIALTIERLTASNKLGDLSASSFANVKRIFQGDLGFARIRKIEKLDRTDDYVYCFQLADDEVPGFFTGDGAVFTHNCFGYLSYRNAKFGKIDCHIAVCALARETLVGAMQTAEADNYRVIHGIVDSLWLSKKGATHADYEELCKNIKKNTGFEAAVEGVYKWIVFLPSKVPPRTRSITNRYFGCFEKSNQIKVRGIEYRRHDTPAYFKECQEAILLELAKCDTKLELQKAARTAGVAIFERYAKKLEDHEVSPIDLVITRRLSKNPSEYSSKRQLQVNAALKLETEGLKLQAGQSISYVITRFDSKGKDRSYPQEFAREDGGEYDSKRYVELLADCCASILDPLGVSKEMLLTRTKEEYMFQ